MREAEPLGDCGGHDGRALVHAEHGGHRMRLREPRGGVGARGGIVEVERKQTGGVPGLHRARLFGRHGHLHPETLGRGEKVGNPVARRRKEEKDTRHPAMLSAARQAIASVHEENRQTPEDLSPQDGPAQTGEAETDHAPLPGGIETRLVRA